MKNSEFGKGAFDKIKVSKEVDERVFNNTIYKKDKKYNLKRMGVRPSFIAVGIALFFVTSVVALAQEQIRNYLFSREKGFDPNGSEVVKENITITEKVSIKDNANLVVNTIVSSEKIEQELGIKLLSNKDWKSTEEYYVYEAKKNSDGNIQKVYIYNEDNHDKYDSTNEELYRKKYLTTSIQFMTNYADAEDEEYFNNYNLMYSSDEKELENSIKYVFNNRLGVQMQIELWSTEKEYPMTGVKFVYNGILYSYFGYQIDEAQMMKIVDNLK